MVIELTPEEFKEAEDIPGEGHEIVVDKPFNSKMTEIFQGSNIEETLEQMFAYIKTEIENHALPESGFTLDSIIHLDIRFHKLQLTQGNSYIELLSWIYNKKAVLNPRNEEDEECFKWAVIAALHHEDIQKDSKRISKLKSYSNLYNWEGMDFPVTVSQIDKFEKNEDIAVKVLYIYQKEEGRSKGKIAILRRSDGNIT